MRKKKVLEDPPKAHLAKDVPTDVVVAPEVGPDSGTLADCKESTAHHTSILQVMTETYIHSDMSCKHCLLVHHHYDAKHNVSIMYTVRDCQAYLDLLALSASAAQLTIR